MTIFRLLNPARRDFIIAALLCAFHCAPSWSQTVGTTAKESASTPSGAKLPPPATRIVDFVVDIQPLFADRCYQCHGPEKQQGGLRLDLKSAALAGGDSGKSIDIGQSAKSRLVHNIAGLDPDTVMPPQGNRLTESEVALVRAWIDQGAVWPEHAPGNAAKKSDHWSFQPLHQYPVPVVQFSQWVRNPIDAFILARLEREKITPASEADRSVLIRRLYLDLLGLIPDPLEIDEFIADSQPHAYERLVERILESPHFGERWGRHWLDLARYADSDGYEKDNARPFAYRYRDWVIESINRDQSFDQFTIEQLAGDLLPGATQQQRMATGFHRNTLTNTEGGANQEEFRVAATVDRVNTLGSVWLGITVGCAQCHSHKYDPFTQREYYQLFAFLNSIQEVNLPAPTVDETLAFQAAKRRFDEEHQPFIDAIHSFEAEQLSIRQERWEQSLNLETQQKWDFVSQAAVKSENGATIVSQSDGSWLVTGKSPATDIYTIRIPGPMMQVSGIRLEVLPDEKLPSRGPGRVAHGNFVLSELKSTIISGTDTVSTVPLVLKNPRADFEQGGPSGKVEFPIAHVLDGKLDTGWAVANQLGVRHAAVFECEAPLNLEASQSLEFRLEQQHGTKHTIGKFRFSTTTARPPFQIDGMPETVVEALRIASSVRTDVQKKAIRDYYQTIDPKLMELRAAEQEHLKRSPAEPATKGQMVQELGSPRPTAVLIRGDFLRKGDPVQMGTPAMLPRVEFDPKTSNRLDLAKWLVDPAKNPLTPRVTVNLWWQHLFGRGIVATVEDFGVRGERPSHPELLDWLALQLVQQRWSRKELIKLIVNSATYRQNSRHRPELQDRDPKNVWLSHQNRYRLEAEVVRDLYLASSGLLNRKVGGPSVRPPLPQGVAELGYAGSIKWPVSTGSDKYRRGMYIFFQRTVPYPMLMAFDTPDSNSSCVRRERSNTPLQALTLLNDPVFFECAQGLGHRMTREIGESKSGHELVDHLVRRCLGRSPSTVERERLARLYDELKLQIAQQPQAAKKIAGTQPMSGTEMDNAVIVMLARIILNLDEFLVRE